MRKTIRIFFLLSAALLLVQCSKEEENWVFCACGIETWVGNYRGDGDYYKNDQPDPETVHVEVDIEQIAAENVKIDIQSPDHYTGTFYAVKNDSTYYLTVNGSNKSLNLNLKVKGGAYKLTGTAKNFHTETNEDSTYTVFDKVLSFDVLKNVP